MRVPNTYMHPRYFVRNHIDFRISTSKSFADFKKAQAFILDQVSNNPYHKFSTIAKEIILLKYDIWFDYLVELEQYLLCTFDEVSKKDRVDESINLSDDRVVYYMNLLKNQFKRKEDIEYIDKWSVEHTYIYEFLVKTIRESSTESPQALFRSITANLIKVMNHTIYELQELDILLYDNSTPSLNIDDICFILNERDGNYLIEKIERYQKIRTFNKINVKSQVSSGEVSIICKKWLDLLKEQGLSYTIA